MNVSNELWLILGLVIFLGVHSIRFIAPGWRRQQIARLGDGPWKGLYSLVSIIGFALIVWGFGVARAQPVPLYAPPLWLRHLNAVFTLLAFVLLAAAFVPHNRFKKAVGHPMVLGTKVWAFGHLLATGMLHDVLLFGAFLLWTIVAFGSLRRQDRAAGVVYPPASLRGDTLTVLTGTLAWVAFAFLLHGWLIGVRPFG
jgi:uncharacterized membrane protein